MICSPCTKAGAIPFDSGPEAVQDKKFLHAQCQGKTHCDCQHKVGPSSKFIQEKANKADEKD